jgi:4-amino-4-deoxy-L-arabinose transferase-like glycosyltransferase
VPAALDIFRAGAWIPRSAVPNVHPPGVMAYLAGVWTLFGYSIPATRAAMLALAALTAFCTFLLAIELCRGLKGAPALAALLLLLADPLFYTQSMMAQLDMPAMLFTTIALLLFVQGRHALAGLACVGLVLVKETGALAPLVFALALLFDPPTRRNALWYAPAFIALAVWLMVLWRVTGTPFGDPGFAHYNIAYSLHPVRAVTSLARRAYFLFFADSRWIGTLGLIVMWRRLRLPANPAWRITLLFAAAHVVAVSLLGGAELERYLLPVLPILYIAFAAAWTTVRPLWRNAGLAAITLGLLLGLFLNPPFPFPYENNLAMADFVELHQSAAQFLERMYPTRSIYTAWPLTAALRRPEFGYVSRGLHTEETSDLHYSTLSRLDPAAVDVLVLYSRTWEPAWGATQWPLIKNILTRFYEYEPQIDSEQARDKLGLTPIARWTERGQWIEIYARTNFTPRATVSRD